MVRFLLGATFRISLAVCFIALASTLTPAQNLPGAGEDEGKTVVYRDTWGIPHIYAPTVEAGMFAMGWAQAEDRPEELLKNLARGMGESARFSGEGGVQGDVLARMWDHYGVAQREVDTLLPAVRSHMQAYVDGVNAFYAAHPQDRPAWWGDRPVDVPMVIAFGRLFLYSWSIDDGFGDLKRAGIEPGFDRARRGSNQFAVAPSRSASGNAILYIDPHLAWFGPSRFWEFRIHAGDLHGSGFNLAGTPYIGLGHNANLAWAMTTGAPDTADIYELKLNPDNPMQYQYDGAWKDITTREVTIDVKDAGPVTQTLYDSHYGPVVAMTEDKAYALKTSYADIVKGNEAWYHLNFATDYTGAVAAMKTGTMFPQNVMVADTAGNIYYQRSGRVPVRPDGYDWSRPVDGSTSATEWQGIHDADDHLQVLNPPQGYMQNCNIPPDAMMVDSPFQPEKYKPYLFSDRGYGPLGGWTNQRGARAVELLHNDDSVTVEEALAYAVDVQPYGADRWVNILREAHAEFGDRFASNADYQRGMEDLLAWDFQEARYSTGALKYYYWRKQLEADYGEDTIRQARGIIDQYYKVVSGEAYTAPALSRDQRYAAADAFARAMAQMRRDFLTIDVPWGEVFRVGRDGESWPSGGGGGEELGITTLRNVSYGGPDENHMRMGRGGQTSTQIIHLSKPIQSWTQPPIGQSDRPDSPHYADQAEKLFSKRILKPTWWLPEDLAKHIESRVELTNPGSVGGEAAARVAEWKDALQGAQIEALMNCYADDFAGNDGIDKTGLEQFLRAARDNGALDNIAIEWDGTITEKDGKARTSDITLRGGFGTAWVTLELEPRNGAWKITRSITWN